MKNTTMRLMIAAAALAVAVGTASAQTYKAEVPMSFHAAGKVLAPGSYQIHVDMRSGRGIVSIRNLETSSSLFLVSVPGSDAPKAWREAGVPTVSFTCVNGSCTLSRLWDGQDVSTYNFPSKELPTIEARGMNVVTLALVKAR